MTGAIPASASAGHHPAITPRLAVDAARAGPLDLARERALGTYRPTECADLAGELEAAHLRGRGGAAFPAHVKWRAVADAPAPRVVVANGQEGEPVSGKDRWLLTHRPHLVLDGLLLAAAVVGADRAVVYLSHPETAAAVTRAVAELRAAGGVPPDVRLDVHRVRPGYVAGDETAVCRAISGGPALPAARPPRPAARGVDGHPTLVSNVETLAHAAWIGRHGAAAYRRYGTAASPGTTLVTLGGACARPGVYEVPLGLPLAGMCDLAGGGLTAAPTGFVLGGWSGGVLAATAAEVAFCYDALRAAGAGLGCGAVTVLGDGADPVALAAGVTSWYAGESARQCGVCINGTVAIRDAFAALHAGRAGGSVATDLARWGRTLPGRGACALLDGAAAWARTVPEQFPQRVSAGQEKEDGDESRC